MNEGMRALGSLSFILGSYFQLNKLSHIIGSGTPIDGVNPSTYILMCQHEASNLLEDLDMIRWYLDPDNVDNSLSKTINDMRNHMRHDCRDNVNKCRGDNRRRNLGVRDGFVFEFTIINNGFNMGSTNINFDQVGEYITWAETKISKYIPNLDLLKSEYADAYKQYYKYEVGIDLRIS